ncbi:MAG: class I SAM-dependent methyltransferase [Bacteroidales bacterium]
MFYFLKTLYQFICLLLIKPILNKEKKINSNLQINERPIEYSYSLKYLSEISPKSILDIGSGQSSWPHLLSMCGYNVDSIDKIEGYWKGNFFNRHFPVKKTDILKPQINRKYQFITCLSVLEHIPNHKLAFKNMIDLLEKEGYLLLTFPYNEHYYYSNIYDHLGLNCANKLRFITQIYSRQEINSWLEESPCTIINQSYFKVFDGELWAMGNRISPTLSVSKNDIHHLTCILIKKE